MLLDFTLTDASRTKLYDTIFNFQHWTILHSIAKLQKEKKFNNSHTP